jgi:hypothetical protein
MFKNKKLEKIIIAFSVVSIVLFVKVLISEPAVVTDVKSGKAVLTCQMSDGWVEIDKSKVVSLDSSGYWIFTNGYAKNCSVN